MVEERADHRTSRERRLAAILAADIAGYSRLMSHDEEGTLDRLKAHRRELVDPSIERHHGRIVKTTGDGMLVEFASVVDAVRCATEVQRAMAERNVTVPPPQRIEFRIGINVGDIIVDGGDLFGDGVNVAARLEGLAEAGGICVSGRVHEDVKGRLDVGFADMGEQQLKNIDRPVRVYRVNIDGGGAVVPPHPVARALPDRPSIAVLPFANMSGDTDQEYFSDGITEDLITALAGYRWFFVIARNSTFVYKGRAVDVKQVAAELGVRYVLEGSVRRAGRRVRITAQLIDADNGRHIWAERYDRELEDVFAVQDEITEQVTGAIEPELLKSEGGRASRITGDLTAWDLLRQGIYYFHQLTEPTHRRARELIREAIARDPELGEAQVWLSRVNTGMAAYGWCEDREAALRESMAAALKAVQRDEKDAYAHYALALVYIFSGAFEQGVRAAERSTAISPSFALAHLALGMARLFAGHAAEAIEPLERGLRLNPFDPQNIHWFRSLALARYFAGKLDQALDAALQALKSRPAWPLTLETLAICYAALDRLPEARRCIEQMRQLEPPKADPLAVVRQHAAWAADLEAMLRKAGYP